ncbi:GNAT family N-acetyltransferase [Flagellimonas sp.]|uniref:GNAT family N-acetyltransferase n=1 Tax=Flagellimonas sp. TaxID=2058762 RepID=UPI003F4A382C
MDFDFQPKLENDLIRLRPLRAEDFTPLLNVASDPKIWEQHPDKERHTLKGFKVFFESSLASKGCLVVIDRESRAIIGSSRYKMHPNEEDAIEIGWTFLARQYWGGSYNGSVKTLMIDHAFQYVSKILFFVDRYNVRSQKAVENLLNLKKFKLLLDKKMKADGKNITYILRKA